MNWIETQFWRIALWILKQGYGYCDERDGEPFLSENRCGGCEASDVQDWIRKHIELINDE